MHADVVSQADMLGTVFGNPNYRAENPAQMWQAAEVVALHFGMKWFAEHLPYLHHMRFPDLPGAPVPRWGSGILFTWHPILGINPDRVLKATYVGAFSGGFVFDPCVIEPVPAQVYDAGIRQRGGLVAAIILRDPDMN